MRIGLAWPPGVTTGWGVLALNMTLEMLKRADVHPFLVLPPHAEAMEDPMVARLLAPLAAEQKSLTQILERAGDKTARLTHPMIHSLTNHLRYGGRISDRVRGRPDLAYLFLENTDITAEDKARATELSLILAGSSWNEAVLRGHGIDNVATLIQGVDTSLFHPAPKRSLFPGRFVVFGGGSLCHRKGQDIVVAAFKAFQQRHPEAFLLTAWQNPAPWTAADVVTGGHVSTAPNAGADGGVDVKGWLIAEGIPADACLDVGAVPNPLTPRLLREADAALFPNRAEGGTNMVAMEAMACGVPCILSDGHGHRDLVTAGAEHCLPIAGEASEAATNGLLAGAGTDGWTEVPVEACVEALETLYQDAERRKTMGENAAKALSTWTWPAQVERLIQLVTNFS